MDYDRFNNLQIIDTLADGTAHYIQRTQLDGSEYILIFNYNSIAEGWYLSIQTADGEDIEGYTGVRLTQNWEPFKLATALAAPPGDWLVSSETQGEPGLFDLGDGTNLYYIPLGTEG